MTFAFIVAALLMLVGILARLHVAIFRWLYIPASVIAGLLGLLLVQTVVSPFVANRLGLGTLDLGTTVSAIVGDLAAEWSRWPGWLIAVVFAGLLLETRPKNFGSGLRRTASQVVMVWVIVVGQTAVGLLLTWLAIQPFYEVPNSFGMLIETGFAGGHGTAAAMGLVFSHPEIALESGLDLGILMATAGLVYGVVSGIFWINIAAWLGWIKPASAATVGNRTIGNKETLANKEKERPAIGFQVIDREVVDPLLLQIVWLTLAFGIGLVVQWLVGQLAISLDQYRGVAATELAADAEGELAKRLRLVSVFGSFPLFIYTLLGGWTVRKLLHWCSAESLIDNATLMRLSSVAMDILVVAAIGSLSLQAVASLLVPFTILLVGGVVWTAICLMVISRMILPGQHWFQLGLINYGMSTGTTATGFVLLRIVDPELRTQAAEDYALAAPFSAPFIGGGMITVGLPLLVLEKVPIGFSAIAATILVIALLGAGRLLRSAKQTE